jgi:hypothetical protein
LVSRNITGWAACPSSFNTHWYVNYDDLYSLTYTPDHKVVKSEAEAYYHNYDFGDPSMATYARHWSLLNGDNNGYTTYTHNIVHSGESWGLLSGNVYYE